MKLKNLAIPALLTLLTVPSFADELLKFKSGYEMMVVSHREEGRMIIVTLEGGGEVGFPKEVLELLEGGKATQRTGDSPLFNKVPSRVTVGRFIAKPQALPSRFLAKGVTSTEGAMVGYSKGGDPQQRFSGGPIGDISANGRVGIDIRDRGRNRHPGRGPDEGGHAKPSNVKTIDAMIPPSPEGGF